LAGALPLWRFRGWDRSGFRCAAAGALSVAHFGTGDVDLYVRRDKLPTLASYLCRPYLDGNNETCNISSSGAGDYYIMLSAYGAYSGVTLQASY
jgi:hypothetical protein